ncbi:MAG TPA: cell division protein ZapA [Usitatibacteraceae bacterium]|nr:cell division protein ZapA [Usitatibacteraceae bacterium]
MSDARDRGMTIQVLGREFRVACPEGEEQQLAASVEFLNRRIKDLRDGGKVVGNERIAVMAALNIAHEYLAAKPAKASSVDGAEHRRRIAAMQETLASALAADQDKLF